MDIQTISIALAGIGIFLAAINFIVSSRQANQQRQMELLMQLYDRYSQPEFAKRWYTRARVRFNNPTFGDHIEYLYDEITKYHTDDVITPTRTRNFR